MSEISDNPIGLTAGNTNTNLAGTDRDEAIAQANLPSAVDLDAVAAEQTIKEATVTDTPVETEVDDDPLDYENTFDVSRAEFNELQDAFLRLTDRIDKYNRGASHKI